MKVEPDPAFTLRAFALAALASSVLEGSGSDAPALALLADQRDRLPSAPDAGALAAYLRAPAPADAPLAALSAALGLAPIETLAVALAAAVEEDVMVGRALAHLQAPVGASRPTLGLLAGAFAAYVPPERNPLEALAAGVAVRSGLLVIAGGDAAPLPERAVSVPLAVCLALAGREAAWPGAAVEPEGVPEVPLPPSILEAAARHAAGLAAAPRRALVLRTGSPAEGRSAAAAVARALGRRPAFVDPERTAGLAPWLILRGLVPVFELDVGPGERRTIPPLPLYDGPMLALTGPDGAIATASGTAMSWSLPVPGRDERRGLWERAVGDPDLAGALARHHRHGSGRIAHLGRLAHHQSAIEGRSGPTERDVIAASWVGEGAGLDGLAQPLTASIPDEALVVPPSLRADLDALLQRCRARDLLAEGLGPSATSRYTPGVRALFVGPSGTGKTLAAGWIATRLGLPLYRVDLASVTSKYIGETEKNLAQLLARAEHAEVVLLFDEADSLFGKRTDVKEANDRFANAQTNYLLQRIETFEGIALLTSNSQSRFDAAFTRRLDMVLEFPQPGPEQRRALWESHLGAKHRLSQGQVNQLAALADVGGGQIRNAVLAAAVLAHAAGRPIERGDVLAGLASEYRKIGRQMPVELKP
jgi:hypothetical protein